MAAVQAAVKADLVRQAVVHAGLIAADGKEKAEALLWLWAAWQGRIQVKSVGYPSRVPIGQWMRRAENVRQGQTPLGVDMETLGLVVDRAVAALPERYREPVMINYLWMPDDAVGLKARRAGCCERTFRDRLSVARQSVWIAVSGT